MSISKTSITHILVASKPISEKISYVREEISSGRIIPEDFLKFKEKKPSLYDSMSLAEKHEILENAAKIFCDIQLSTEQLLATDSNNTSFLMLLCQHGCTEGVKAYIDEILDTGGSVKDLISVDNDGRHIMHHLAVCFSNPDFSCFFEGKFKDQMQSLIWTLYQKLSINGISLDVIQQEDSLKKSPIDYLQEFERWQLLGNSQKPVISFLHALKIRKKYHGHCHGITQLFRAAFYCGELKKLRERLLILEVIYKALPKKHEFHSEDDFRQWLKINLPSYLKPRIDDIYLDLMAFFNSIAVLQGTGKTVV